MSIPRLVCLGLLLPLAWVGITQLPPLYGVNEGDDLAAQLRHLNADLFAGDAGKAKQLAGMLAADAQKRIRAANERESKRWHEIKGPEVIPVLRRCVRQPDDHVAQG